MHQCEGCHNPQSWDFDGGHPMSTEEIMRIIEADPYTQGVTFSGGDPMYQPEGFAELAQAIKERTTKTIWCYTGFTYEALITNPRQFNLLQYVDVLVDGPFVKSKRDESLCFRGSRNQRLIDVQASLKSQHVILYNQP
jgi:anaerobic ribonucleoside-triphosphate reductase activating protein